MSEVKIYCKYDKLENPKLLKEHPENPNDHGQDQIDRLAEMYSYHGIRHPIIISNLTGYIVAGHGRRLAAIRAGIKEFPTVYQDFDDLESEYAFIVSDNAISLWAELDKSKINHKIQDLGPDFDINMLGIFDFTIDVAEKDENQGNDEYSKKISSPIYEPTGEKPKIESLCDSSKSTELILAIEKSNLKKELKDFLKYAAYRHLKFDYKNIAEYYAHSTKEEQEFFENSALVIIDFDKAVENGFVKLSKEINDSYLNNNDYNDFDENED